MLTLSRKTGQAVIINGNIRLFVVKVQGNKVQLSFDAPADVPIFREEVIEHAIDGAKPKPTSLTVLDATLRQDDEQA